MSDALGKLFIGPGPSCFFLNVFTPFGAGIFHPDLVLFS
jgi:hypothetical protein